MSAITYGYGSFDGPWKGVEGDSKSNGKLDGAAAVAVLAKGLELKGTNLSLTNFDEFEPLDFFRDGKSLLRQQTTEVVFGRSDMPAVFVKFWAAVSSGFGMARGDKRGKRFPNCAAVEQMAVWECGRLAKTEKNEMDVVATVSPDFADGFYDVPFFLAELHFCKERDVSDSVVAAVGFAKDLAVLVALQGGAVGIASGEDLGRR